MMNKMFKDWVMSETDFTEEEMGDEDFLSEAFIETMSSFRTEEELLEWAFLEGARREANACRVMVGMAPDHDAAADAMWQRCESYKR